MIYVGIDIAKLNHFASALSSDGEILLQPFSFSNSYDGFCKLQTKLEPFGSDNLVINGSHFYLIGKLDPNVAMKNGEMTALSETDLSDGIVWPVNRALPPYDADGNTIKERRVFMQGFKTVAKFGIGEESLQKAYLTVPDLRSANISLGLTVDLDWKDGLQYDIELGK